MSRKTCIVLVGGPCSGKSSVGKLVAQKLDIEYISSGDIAREMAKHDSVIDNSLNNGNLAPENQMRKSIWSRLVHCFDEMYEDVAILDGFPRFGEQAEWLRKILPASINIKYVLFHVPMSTIIERSTHRNRADDKSLENRIKYYYGITYKELYDRIDVVIDADENNVDECSALLANYIIKEVL